MGNTSVNFLLYFSIVISIGIFQDRHPHPLLHRLTETEYVVLATKLVVLEQLKSKYLFPSAAAPPVPFIIVLSLKDFTPALEVETAELKQATVGLAATKKVLILDLAPEPLFVVREIDLVPAVAKLTVGLRSVDVAGVPPGKDQAQLVGPPRV